MIRQRAYDAPPLVAHLLVAVPAGTIGASYSDRPDVCDSRFLMRIGRHAAGASGKYFVMLSSSEIFPSPPAS